MKMRQRGATLLELILVVGLVALGTLLAFYTKQADLEQARARQMGGYIYQYNNAVRNYIAKNIGLATPTTKVGTTWLKNTTCGGTFASGSEFLPCDFPSATVASPLPYGNLSFTTVLTSSGSAPTRKVTATTTTTPFKISFKGQLTTRSDLAGLSALSAAAALMTGYQKSGTGVSPYTATTDSNYKADPLTGIITMTASNNASNDVWLRTDGGNNMHASLQFDGSDPTNRQILGASRIQNLAGQLFTIGAATANGKRLSAANSTVGSGVIVESDMEVVGRLLVDRSADIAGSLGVTGDASIGGNASVNGTIYTQRIVDLNDGTFYLDPNGISSMNSTRTRSITANPAMGTTLDLNAQQLQIGQIDGAGNTSNAGVTTMAGNVDVRTLNVNRGGQLVSMYDLMPEWVLKQGWIANDNEGVTKPACGVGQPMVIVTPRAIPLATLNKGAGYDGYYLGRSYFYAYNSGTYWTIKADSAYTGAQGQAIVMTYCYYPK
ncbi:type II secretion system protein [Pseudomonas amygdali]|uniref:Prepilin-type N-terminal cleavage/methylation domain-containing protein n=1 Tax=Pseudomonas amygdali pv. lachrymans TaxID=53707 RepID=A0ABR5KQ38_PSEAV|nr:type II secretion system protein [Pseudomonas amygdali]KPC16912.1 Uncharacterized protein AC499_0114 [Pseudomonas amygdali pv. lachrymans]KPC17871.1 Uncharacterized protein AC499_1073 [Pseudomonas amygdali pv. lachrymans]RMT06537.1 hypothetical protein ALP54_03413 [Pseudomonas amygdali pv. lachrymans]